MRIAVDHPRVSPQFDAAAGGVVDQEQESAGILRQIAERDVLLVAAVVGEGQRRLVDDLDESFRAAAVLGIGLPERIGGREDRAVDLRQERGEVGVTAVLKPPRSSIFA